jgi:uncharacterized protein YbjT (DUF2867 family)
MILVTGASGTIGKTVLRLLAGRGVPARAMTRDPQRITSDAEVVWGDFEDATSLRRAVDGVRAVFLVSAAGPSIPAHELALLGAAPDVAKIVKVSAIHTGTPGFEGVSAWHLPGEQALQAGGKAWTILRPSVFTSNTAAWIPQIQAGEEIPNHTGSGQNGVVDPRDIAAVAVEALVTDEHDRQIYTLTGPELLSTPDQVADLGEVLGRPLKTVDISPEQAEAGMLAQGMDRAAVDLMLTGFEIVRSGRNAVITDDVERVLGRRPRAFREWAADHREIFG